MGCMSPMNTRNKGVTVARLISRTTLANSKTVLVMME